MLHLDEAQDRIVSSLTGFLSDKTRSWRVLLVSDIRARQRVILWCPKRERNAAEQDLDQRLTEVGGPYWSSDVLSGQESGELPDGAWQDDAWAAARWVDEAGRLRVLERHLSKAGWFNAPSEPPWPLDRRNREAAAVCGFYSFKGGVGRSTGVAATALQFAAQGDRVVVLDADLDSPGVGSLLHGHDGSIAEVGVVDHLIEAPLMAPADDYSLEDYYHRCPPDLHRGRGEVLVFPAGRMNQRYIGKLARLDYGVAAGEPHRHPLAHLLQRIGAELDPQWILIDARAGLGEVSGFLTGGLCHLYVLLGTSSDASWRGLELVLDRLGGERLSGGQTQCECLLVAAMIPSDRAEQYEQSVSAFTDRARDAFSDFYYAEPGEREVAWTVDDLANASDAPHVPVGFPYDSRLALFGELEEVAESVLLRPESPYSALADRIDKSVAQLRGGS